MNNQIKIVQENGSFVGYLLKAGEMVFSTPPCPDAPTASKLVSEHLKLISTASAAVPVPVSTVTSSPQRTSATVPANAVPATRSGGGCGCRRG